jgi:hypothetical protein
MMTESTDIEKPKISQDLPIACPWVVDQALAAVFFLIAAFGFYG